MKSKKKNKDTKKIITVLVAIALIIAIIGGATFAYWSWQTNTAQQTNISVEVKGGSLTITSTNIASTVSLYPTTDCDGNGALKSNTATVTAVNETESTMRVHLKLNGTLQNTHGSLNTTNKGKLHWAVIKLSKDASNNPVEPSDNACASPLATGTFASVSSNTDIDTGITFDVTGLSTVTEYYKVYVWLDSSYEYTNSGDTISDPMQDLKITVKWSTNSLLTQQLS